MRRQRKAFTLIELIVVIMILAILAGLVSYGLSRIAANQREKSTRTMLANLDSMLQELKMTNQTQYLPVGAVYAPFVQGSGHGLMTDDVATSSHAIRYKSDAVKNTQKVMMRMVSVPANKALLAKLPAENLLSQPNPQVSIGRNDLNVVGGKINPPLPLDGWGNPIIYIGAPDPSTASGAPQWLDRYGLRGVWLAALGNYYPPPGDLPHVTNPRQPYPNENAPNAAQLLRTFRPFWASAGPDGDFTRGDDNIYSFEN